MSTPEIIPQTDKGPVFFRKIFDFLLKKGWLSWEVVTELITHFTVRGEVEQGELIELMGCRGCEAHTTFGDRPVLERPQKVVRCPALQRRQIVWSRTPCQEIHAK